MGDDRTGKVLHQFCSRRQAAIRQATKEGMPGKPELGAENGQQPDSASGKQPYRAVLVDTVRPQRWLRLHYPDGETVRLLSYNHLVEAVTTSHKHLSLIFTHKCVTLTGRNLAGLIEMIQDERIQALVCFHAKHHLPPEDKLMPCIEAMVNHDATGAWLGG